MDGKIELIGALCVGDTVTAATGMMEGLIEGLFVFKIYEGGVVEALEIVCGMFEKVEKLTNFGLLLLGGVDCANLSFVRGTLL